MVELPSRELVVPVRVSLSLWLPILVANAVAIGIGIYAGPSGGPLVLALIGTAGIVLAAVAMVRPPKLVLDAEGMAMRTPIGQRWRRPWSECGEFRVWRTFVVWASPAEAAAAPRRAASWRRRAEGADAGVAASFGGLSAPDLAALLNRYRSAAVSR